MLHLLTNRQTETGIHDIQVKTWNTQDYPDRLETFSRTGVYINISQLSYTTVNVLT